MTPRKAFASVLQFFVVFGIFTAGFFFTALPLLPKTLNRMIEMLTYKPEFCTRIGAALLVLSFFLFLAFYAFNRGKYLVLRMGVKTNLKVIRYAVEDCFAKQFPKQIALKDIEVGPKSILEFSVALSEMNEAKREEFYEEVEAQLGILLYERFGYSKSFDLITKL